MLEVKLTIETPNENREYVFDGDHVTIGRGEQADLAIDDTGLSRVHASIHREGDRVWILDEASTNGTSVNGTPVSQVGTPLFDGDEIMLGETAILVTITEQAKVQTQPQQKAQEACRLEKPAFRLPT